MDYTADRNAMTEARVVQVDDEPRMLATEAVLSERLSALAEPHIEPLAEFVHRLREQMGPDARIPYFDPWDGGTDAEVLVLLEAPGAKARNSGFVSMNNPDETAKNFFLASRDATLPRRKLVMWNIIPWYIGTEVKIRPAKGTDIREGKLLLRELLELLPKLRAIVLMGRSAQKAESDLLALAPDAKIFQCPHPSPLYVNNKPENRGILVSKLSDVSKFLVEDSTYET